MLKVRKICWANLLFLTLILSLDVKAVDIEHYYPDDPNIVRRNRQAGKLIGAGSDLPIYQHQKKNNVDTGSSKNSAELEAGPLWKAAVEVISQLFPIEVLDPKMGLIITDWSIPDGPSKDNNKLNPTDKRIKINVLVKKSGEDRIIVSVYKQKLNKNAMWESVHESQEEQALMIKNKILATSKNYAR